MFPFLVSFSLHLFSLYITHSPTPCPFDAPESSNLCVYPYSPCVFTSDFLSFLYPSLIYICLKSLSSPLTHPAHLNNPLTVFIHLFFFISHSPFALFCLLSIYPLFHPVACPCLFLVPIFLFIIYFLDLICLFYLFYLCSFISFHYFPHNYFVTTAFLFTFPSSLLI